VLRARDDPEASHPIDDGATTIHDFRIGVPWK
jgi:hypothetical protein